MPMYPSKYIKEPSRMRNPNTLHPYKITAVLALMAVAAILAFATVMTVSAQSDDRDWKQSRSPA